MHAKVLRTVLIGSVLGAVSCTSGEASIVPDETGGARPANETGGSSSSSESSGSLVGTGGMVASSGGTQSVATGGDANTGGATTSVGGAPMASGGASGGTASAGNTGSGGVSTGGVVSSGSYSGGQSTAGGDSSGDTGGTASGGEFSTGGNAGDDSGGSAATGGVTNGGATGSSTTGGVTSGGTMSSGGAASGGTAATGGSTVTGGTAATGGTAGTSTVDPCAMTTLLTGGKTYYASSSGSVGNGYVYEVTISNSPLAFTNATVYGKDAAFKSNWSTTYALDFATGVGLSFDSTKTYSELGTLTADFAFSRTGTGSYTLGIHGMMASPAVEYFIIEDVGGTRPSFGTKLGTVTIDGGQYDVYRHTPVGPGATGNTQYYSVRSTGRQCGHISISEHFRQWATIGFTLGKLGDCKLRVAATSGAATVDFTWATVVVE